MRVSYVSCICNSFGSHETYHCLYGKTQRCSCSGFRFVKQIILRNRSYVNMALNSRGRRMSEKIKTAIVQYLLMLLSVEAIRSWSWSIFTFIWSADKACTYVLLYRTVAILQRTQKNKKQQHTFVFIFKDQQDVFVKHNAPDNGQFQWRPRSQGQIFWYQ